MATSVITTSRPMGAIGWLERLVTRLRPRHVEEDPPGPPPPPHQLIVFLRDIGVALCESGDATSRVTRQLEDLADRYGAEAVQFFVLPTGVFVRIGTQESATVDFAPVTGDGLRLDQIGELYALLEEAGTTRLPPAEGARRLAEILEAPARFSPWLLIVSQILLTVGLGLIRNPIPAALIGYIVLGAAVGGLRLLAVRFRVLSLALPVTAALLVTVVSFEFADILAGGDPALLLIPPLIMFLPGSALTIGTIELASGAMVAGAARLMYGINILFLMAFGILAGIQISGSVAAGPHPAPLGWWAPWAGVLLVGIGLFVTGSAPARYLPWMLLVLYAVWIAQFAGGLIGSTLLGSFLGGLLIIPLAYAVQKRRNGPPAQVTFLPTFWLMVPGALGLAGVSELVAKSPDAGFTDLITALVTVMAIALGVLVGSSLTQATSRHHHFHDRNPPQHRPGA